MAQPVVVSLVCSTLVFIHFGAGLGSQASAEQDNISCKPVQVEQKWFNLVHAVQLLLAVN